MAESPNNTVPRIPWAGKVVYLQEVEEHLSLLWKNSADNMRIGMNTNVRTSVLNLVICAPDVDTAKRASALLRELSSTHLARVAIVILDSSEDTASVTSWVTLRCFSVISDVMRHCFEQMTLRATGSAMHAIANIIQPLLKPDLPVYLWWLGDPPEDGAMFERLVSLSNRVIFDSASFFHPEQNVLTMARLSQSFPDCALSDLNWGRITPWRQLIVQFFDAMEYRPYLAGVNSIEIEHAVAPLAGTTQAASGDVSPNPTRAFMLAGWLKERLGWSLAPGGRQKKHDPEAGAYHWKMERFTNPRRTRALNPVTANATGHEVTRPASIDIRPHVYSDMRPGSICLVRLISSLEGKRATFTLSREGDPNNVLTSVTLAHEARPMRMVSLASIQKENDLLHNELEIMGHDYLFEQTLQEVAILGQLPDA